MGTTGDDEQHRREEQERRAKRKAAKSKGVKSLSSLDKERKRKEHAHRVLKEQNKHKRGSSSSSSKQPRPPPGSGSKHKSSSAQKQESSVFESLFTQRAQGFRIDFAFRNAPPRPPVGPCFVGLGLEGELHDSWTRYKPMNAVEVNYSWQLHSEPDLGVPLAPSAMDPSCYQDPMERSKKLSNSYNEDEPQQQPPKMHPDDEALLNWTGPMGDTAAEQLKSRRDLERAAARLALAGTHAAPAPKEPALQKSTKSSKKADSRVLNDKMQSWMKKTTYLSNDYSVRRVHAFTSLAETNKKTAKDLASKREIINERKSTKAIAKTFQDCLPLDGIRQHPTKRHLKPVAELPLLPNASHWGAAYTHVVVDNPPKEVGNNNNNTDDTEDMAKLGKAFVIDVNKSEANARMSCQLLVPDRKQQPQKGDTNDTSANDLYRPAQQYDLEVLPLKDDDQPNVNFVFWINPQDGTASYLPIPSRVMLSTGRPAPRGAQPNILRRQPMGPEDVQDMELRMAEVDWDLANKHNKMDVEQESPATTGANQHSNQTHMQDEEDGLFGNTTQTIVAAEG